MRHATLALILILILAGCTDSSEPEPPPDTSVTSTAPTPTAVTTTVPSTTLPPLPTTTTAPPVVASSPFTPLAVPDEELPHMLAGVTIGDTGLLYSGAVSPTPRDHPNEGAFWHYDGTTWARTLRSDFAPPDEYGNHPSLTNLVIWEGSYLGFITGDFDDPDALPSLLTSDDGRNWTIEPIFPRAAAGSSLGGVFPTPESPPLPVAAGIAGVTTTDDEIVAVGWVATAPGKSTATIWRSTDGRSWTVSALPNEVWPNQWARQISIGESGWLVSGAGPVHGATLVWFSPDGDNWTFVSDAFQNEEGEIWWSFGEMASAADGLVVNAGDLSAEYAEQLWRSDDGLTWTMVGDRSTYSTTLVSDGSTITRMVRGEDSTIVDSSVDGETWKQITELPIKTDPDRMWLQLLDLGLVGSTVTVTELANTEDYTGSTAGLWIDAPLMDVVLVEPDDTLNIRDGVMAEIIGEFEPGATGIQTTGRTDGAAGSLWAEILHNGRLGWVNSLYLTEPVDDFLAMKPMTLVEELAEDVFRNGGPIVPYVGQNGLSVNHYDRTKRWTRHDDPMHDPTIYIWGCPECSPDPGPDHHATFADWVGAGFLSAWDHEDRVIELGGPSLGNTDRFTSLRPSVRNLHYVSVYGPGNGDYDDWKTWYIYFDVVDGALVVAAIDANMWIP